MLQECCRYAGICVGAVEVFQDSPHSKKVGLSRFTVVQRLDPNDDYVIPQQQGGEDTAGRGGTGCVATGGAAATALAEVTSSANNTCTVSHSGSTGLHQTSHPAQPSPGWVGDGLTNMPHSTSTSTLVCVYQGRLRTVHSPGHLISLSTR